MIHLVELIHRRPLLPMRIFLILLIIASPLLSQTRAEIDEKYGPIEGARYRVAPGIAVEAAFFKSGRVKTLRIVPETSRDKNALLVADDVRKLVRELAPGRLCRSPLSTKKLKVPCPPRKECEGIQEEWKMATMLMVWHKESVAYSFITLSDQLIPPPGGIKLLPGYEHVPGCGIDTLGGYIRKKGGIEIHYDIGVMAGNFAMRYADSPVAEWTRTEQLQDDTVLIVLTKENRIVATFETSIANFTANIASQSDIDDFLKIVLTYNPPKRK